ncbi:hypothetical protein [Nocardia sp. alder85J]|uniref:hypothetical protein n=1 Tax=Nocardia sp. alder85J TaxID=2862949 RepID=UPI001CD3CDE7|nr:hypothetical protein [Nocardia sp. alder85J]MCX4090749.1 hypothetical protein [Nocardia sp. alder85J]
MTAPPPGPTPPPGPPGRQVNKAKNKSNVFTNNGGSQHVNITQGQQPPRRTWAWISLAILLVTDVVFFAYGQSAYTGGADPNGDLLRAAVFIALVIGTGVISRICARDIQQRWF